MVKQVRAVFDNLERAFLHHRRKSVGWLIVCLSLTLVTAWRWPTANPAENPVVAPVVTQGSAFPVQPVAVLPIVYEPAAQSSALRDPFMPPPGYIRPVQASAGTAGVFPPASPVGAPSNPSPAVEHSAGVPVSVRPQLVGVADSQEAAIAIIRYGTESRSCRLADHIGPYQVSAIGHWQVTLQGPEGTIVLEMGR